MSADPAVNLTGGVEIEGRTYFGVDAEVQQRQQAKYDKELEQRLVRWIEDSLGEKFGSSNTADLGELLRDGLVLCRLANRIEPNCISTRKISQRGVALAHMENIKQYLDVCANVFHLPSASLFTPSDLYSRRSLLEVQRNLDALARYAVSRQDWNGPAFEGPKHSSRSSSSSSSSSQVHKPWLKEGREQRLAHESSKRSLDDERQQRDESNRVAISSAAIELYRRRFVSIQISLLFLLSSMLLFVAKLCLFIGGGIMFSLYCALILLLCGFLSIAFVCHFALHDRVVLTPIAMSCRLLAIALWAVQSFINIVEQRIDCTFELAVFPLLIIGSAFTLRSLDSKLPTRLPLYSNALILIGAAVLLAGSIVQFTLVQQTPLDLIELCLQLIGSFVWFIASIMMFLGFRQMMNSSSTLQHEERKPLLE